jgi:TRAP-type C4-dicarboxylate transport system permease small subunit
MQAVTRAARLARGGAEAVLAALLLAMFLAFLAQIAMRYVLNMPAAWTTEVSLLAWLWGILWGAALVLREEEEIRFDILHAAAPPWLRRGFDAVTALVVIVVFSASLPATAEYVRFMRIERSASLGLRMDWVFSIWLVFAVAMIIRHAAILWRAVTGGGRRRAA